MTKNALTLRSTLLLAALALLLGVSIFMTQGRPQAQAASGGSDASSPRVFDGLADQALQAMTKRAEALKIHGAAVVAYSEGESVKSWTSKMTIVGQMLNAPTPSDKKGANLLAVAYSKASEMAATLKNSGNAGRPPLNGELGYQGAVIAKGKAGYLIAAFSGGKSEEDVQVSRAGLEVLAGKL